MDIWCLPQLFFTLFLRQFLFLLTLEFADYFNLASEQSLGICYLCLPSAGTTCVCCHTRTWVWATPLNSVSPTLISHLLSPSFHFLSFWYCSCLQGWPLNCDNDKSSKKWVVPCPYMARGAEGIKKWQTQGHRKAGIRWSGLSGEATALCSSGCVSATSKQGRVLLHTVEKD